MKFERDDGYPFIIAEIGANHAGTKDNLLELIKGAKEAGADAAKIQVYTPDEMTLNIRKNEFVVTKGPWRGNLYDLYDRNKIDFKWLEDAFRYAEVLNLPLFASVFGSQSFIECQKYNCPAYKIANFESEYLDLIKFVAGANKPMVISVTDYTSVENYRNIVDMEKLHILYCNNTYPAKINKLGLSNIIGLLNSGNVMMDKVGFSDHTTNHLAGRLAVTLGASILERHLCLNYKLETDDRSFSSSILGFREYVYDCREAFDAIWAAPSNMDDYKRSIYASTNIKRGDKLTYKNTTVIRPNKGMTPLRYDLVLGMEAKYDILYGTPITERLIK